MSAPVWPEPTQLANLLRPVLAAQRWGTLLPDNVQVGFASLDTQDTLRWYFFLLDDGAALSVPIKLAWQEPTSGWQASFECDGRLAWLGEACALDATWQALTGLKVSVVDDSAREQSNTSVVLSTAQGKVIAKVLRRLYPGTNRECLFARALADFDAAPTLVLAPTLAWPFAPSTVEASTSQTVPDAKALTTPPAAPQVVVAVGHQFIAGARDGFAYYVEQLRQALPGQPLSLAVPEQLGKLTAQMHVCLARSLGTQSQTNYATLSRQRLAALTEQLQTLLATSLLDPEQTSRARTLSQQLETVLEPLLAEINQAVTLQAIHGDYHLGQLLVSGTDSPNDLRSPNWYVVDFEGEPLRTETEQPSLAPLERDLASMARSFSYALATAGISEHSCDALVRKFFMAYRQEIAGLACMHVPATHPLAQPGTTAVQDQVLTVELLLKTVYELVYELTHRPTWAHIPLDDLGRMVTHTTQKHGRICL
ncbi:MAG: phosphotransferase [Actinomyces graevenitzii]|nr:phosphotransferase [Actinomyces graevenitzii]